MIGLSICISVSCDCGSESWSVSLSMTWVQERWWEDVLVASVLIGGEWCKYRERHTIYFMDRQ